MQSETFKTNYFDLAPSGKIPLQVLLRYFDECAGQDADRLTVGIEGLNSKKIVWILAKMQIQKLQDIGHNRNITIKTWHVGSDKLLSRRDFVFLDEQNQPVIQGITWWFLMDINTRKIARTPPKLLDLNTAEPVHIMQETPIQNPKLEGVEPLKTIPVITRLEDIDINKHINNTHYIAWAQESIPQEIIGGKNLDQLHINFKAEGFAGNNIEVSSYPDAQSEKQTAFWHILTRKEDGRELVRIHTTWY